MNEKNMRQAIEMCLSWGRVFAAASLAVWLNSGTFNTDAMWQAGLVAVLPVIIRYLDKNDPVYGRGSGDE
jgi:hypothetical protein